METDYDVKGAALLLLREIVFKRDPTAAEFERIRNKAIAILELHKSERTRFEMSCEDYENQELKDKNSGKYY